MTEKRKKEYLEVWKTQPTCGFVQNKLENFVVAWVFPCLLFFVTTIVLTPSFRHDFLLYGIVLLTMASMCTQVFMKEWRWFNHVVEQEREVNKFVPTKERLEYKMPVRYSTTDIEGNILTPLLLSPGSSEKQSRLFLEKSNLLFGRNEGSIIMAMSSGFLNPQIGCYIPCGAVYEDSGYVPTEEEKKRDKKEARFEALVYFALVEAIWVGLSIGMFVNPHKILITTSFIGFLFVSLFLLLPTFYLYWMSSARSRPQLSRAQKLAKQRMMRYYPGLQWFDTKEELFEAFPLDSRA